MICPDIPAVSSRAVDPFRGSLPTITALVLFLVLLSLCHQAHADDRPAFSLDAPCQSLFYLASPYTVCRFDLAKDQPRLFLKGEDDRVFATFERLEKAVADAGETLIFAMNAGMYGRRRLPIGLYVEDGETLKSVNTKEGYGNFHLMPNGVFSLSQGADGLWSAQVMETSAFLASGIAPDFATQSGPMLVIDGNLHPRFIEGSASRKLRNGVGVSADGQTVWFAISDAPVNFHDFGQLFGDHLGSPNALFLDGEVSKLFARNLNRHDLGWPMGPMIAVTRRQGAGHGD